MPGLDRDLAPPDAVVSELHDIFASSLQIEGKDVYRKTLIA
jgi:hypothetical protein